MAEPSQPSRVGGGLPVLTYWAQETLTLKGPLLWKTLLHKSACLSCAWGAGGQKGGFYNEEGETLQRCAKSVEAIAAELKDPISRTFFERHGLAELQQLTSQEADRLGRLSFPVILRAGASYYERLSWQEVYDLAETAFRAPPERIASYSSGRSSNEAAFLLQLLLRSLGSNNLADCSDLCHAASTVGLKQMFGSGTSMVSLADLKQSDCVVLIGSNAPANHPRLMNELIQLRERGGQVIVINPMKEAGLIKYASPAYPRKSLLTGSEIATLYLQPISGSDVAVFVGIQKALLEQDLVQWDYLKQHTEGWEAVIHQAQATDWDTLTDTCGITQQEIQAAAQAIAQAKNVVFAWAMGVTQQANAVDNILAIGNTALLTANAGKPGAGTMPIRGHSNVQGFGSMGVTIRLKEEIRQALEVLLEKSLSRVPGYDTRALITAAQKEAIATLLCLGGNLFSANPNAAQAKQALSQVDTIIYLATKPNLGHFHGLARQNTLILPVFARFENPHRTTTESGNNFVRLNDPGESHLRHFPGTDVISEVTFLTELADRLQGKTPINWQRLQDTQYIRELIARTIPGYEAIANLDQTQAEFTIADRIFHSPHFPTASGRASLFTTPLPTLSLPDLADFGRSPTTRGIVVTLGTGRSYGQHNTVVYQLGDKYRNMPHRNCILMNPADAQKAGLQEHQRVTVQGNVGQMNQVEVIYGEIREGSAMMFYPEVNAIFQVPIDERCGTPAYKRVPVLVFAEAG